MGLGRPQSFAVKPVANLAPGTDPVAVTTFQADTADLQRRVTTAAAQLRDAHQQVRYMRAALVATPRADATLSARLDAATRAIAALERRLTGDPARRRLDESDTPSIADRVGAAAATWTTRQGPTLTQRRALEAATTEFAAVTTELASLLGELSSLHADLATAGAPYIPGRRTP